jgi:outer membrane protein OmpA-like peptidoglycan-associated protein
MSAEKDIMKKLMITAAVAMFALAGCESVNPYTGESRVSRSTYGAGIGALAGAAVGALTNTSNSKQMQKNALIGAGVGALAGAGAGAYMDRQAEELAAELRSTGVSVVREGNNIRLIMPGNITFPTAGDQVNASFYPVLGSVVKVLKKYEQTTVDIAGHTDSDGADDYNLALSQRRANSVASYLVQQGIVAGRLMVVGYGESQPIASNATPQGKSENRRVEIQISPYTG